MHFVVEHIKQLVTVASDGAPFKRGKKMSELGVIEDATVEIKDGLFTWIGPSKKFAGEIPKEAHRLDATGLVGLPGFVDSHTHTVFAGSREHEFSMRIEGRTYQEIAQQGGGVLSTVTATREASKRELKKLAERRLTAMLRQGTTTVEIKSGYGLNPEAEQKMVEVIRELSLEHYMNVVGTFMAAHAIPPEYAGRSDEYVDLICNEMLPHTAKKKQIRFCDVFMEQGYFTPAQTEKIFVRAKELGLRCKLHADQLSDLGGAELAVRHQATSADHLEKISPAGIAALGSSDTVATVLPGVAFFLNYGYPPARQLIDAGAAVAIATNFNPGSCMSYSMPLMLTIAATQMKMTIEECLTAATLNGAAAIGLSASLGSIEVGKQADMILYRVPHYRTLVYHFGENFIASIIKRGAMLEF